MIIYVEGLSCAGKSHLIKKILEDFPNSISIDELPSNYSQQECDFNAYCRTNDEAKAAKAKSLEKNYEFVLVDRGHASTLAYNFIQLAMGDPTQYLKSLAWYRDSIVLKKLHTPDLYVYVTCDSNIIMKRAVETGRFNPSIAWYQNLNAGSKFYEDFFRFVEPEVPLVKIDGIMDTESEMKRLNNFLRQKEL